MQEPVTITTAISVRSWGSSRNASFKRPHSAPKGTGRGRTRRQHQALVQSLSKHNSPWGTLGLQSPAQALIGTTGSKYLFKRKTLHGENKQTTKKVPPFHYVSLEK